MPSAGRRHTKWTNVKKPTPKVLKAIDLLREILADGKAHSAKELKAVFHLNNCPWRYVQEAKKQIGGIDIDNRGRGGAYWQYSQPSADPETAAKNNPEVAKSTEVIRKLTPLSGPLRDRIADAVPGYDPIVSIAEIANDQSVPIAVRLECHRDVAKYTVAQVKATEITSEDQPIALNFKWAE